MAHNSRIGRNHLGRQIGRRAIRQSTEGGVGNAVHDWASFIFRSSAGSVEVVEGSVRIKLAVASTGDIAGVSSNTGQYVNSGAMAGEATGSGGNGSQTADRVPLDVVCAIAAIE